MSITNNATVSVSLAEAADLVLANPKTAFLLQGPPGIGKTSLKHVFQRKLGDTHNVIYFDCINKDLGDVAFIGLNHEKKIAEYFLNGIFQHYTGKPLVIILDEFTKAPQPIQNSLHTLLEASDRRIHDWFLPEGSHVLLTGNMAGDGVGDNIKAHTIGRITRVTVRPSTAEEWLAWAVNNGVDPVVMAWVDRNPQCLDTYLTSDLSGNPYPFNPKVPQLAYVSPRSLERLSDILKNRHASGVTTNALLAAMIGTVGESAARDQLAFVDYQDQLPSWQEVIDNPKTCKLPESDGACAIMAFSAISKVDRNTIAPFMDYVERMHPNWQSVFALNIAKNPAKQQVAFTATKFKDWCLANEDIL